MPPTPPPPPPSLILSSLRAVLLARTHCHSCFRKLHNSRPLFQTGGDLYARLRVRRDASTAEIKRSFYALSKTLHPDVNHTDPNASTTFSLLADAYAILASPTRRAAYDRTLSSSSASSTSASSAPPSYAAGRRRSTPFRGPAPSFYRNGGWGAHAAARRRAHRESTGYTTRYRSRQAEAGSETSSSSSREPEQEHHHHPRHPGMGPGQYPFHHPRNPASDPHFNFESHTRTHQRQDERRRQRGRRALDDEGVEFEPQMSPVGHFFVVATILGLTFSAPFVYLQYTRFGYRQREYD
ncbi:hypothetical protein CP533_5983 [Ophiocordyceps camponoti-saundersi (nom. inval.)]|nr:hypothetical protein CP533_5983 [Ophiocordyceps camponoti-saundersi (nom. inval.)]